MSLAQSEEGEASIHEPFTRFGACSFVRGEQFYLFRGRRNLSSLRRTQNSLEVLDLRTGLWSSLPTLGSIPKFTYGACCTLINNLLYTFGGIVGSRSGADVHELDMELLVWSKLEPSNPGKGPYLKGKAGMIAYGEEMLCVFGGHGYLSENHKVQGIPWGQEGASYDMDPQNGRYYWTNELHLFHIKKCKPCGSWDESC